MIRMRMAAAAALSVMAASTAWAADASGKWTWKMRRGDNEITSTAELKQAGEKLTGTITGGRDNQQKIEIKEGTVKGSDVSFVVVRERNGNQFKIQYKGKIEGDTIKGNTIVNFNGQDRTREWVATRVK